MKESYESEATVNVSLLLCVCLSVCSCHALPHVLVTVVRMLSDIEVGTRELNSYAIDYATNLVIVDAEPSQGAVDQPQHSTSNILNGHKRFVWECGPCRCIE